MKWYITEPQYILGYYDIGEFQYRDLNVYSVYNTCITKFEK